LTKTLASRANSFLINDDIKYRMGQEDGEEGDD
jgi:hypothetical protein